MDKLTVEQQFQKQPKTLLRNILITLIVLAIVYWSSSTFTFQSINERGIKVAKTLLFEGILTPNLLLLFNFTAIGVPYLLFETIAIAFLGTFIGAVVSIPFAFLTARNITGKLGVGVGVAIITFIRTFPPIILGLMFIRVTGPGPFAGVLTLSIASIGMVSKMYIEAIEDLDRGIIESLDASGCNGFQKIRYGILPQLSSNFISTAIYRFEINIKNASILGLVGAGGIGAPLQWAMSDGRWRDVGAILYGLIILIIIVEFISTAIRKKLATGHSDLFFIKMFKKITGRKPNLRRQF